MMSGWNRLTMWVVFGLMTSAVLGDGVFAAGCPGLVFIICLVWVASDVVDCFLGWARPRLLRVVELKQGAHIYLAKHEEMAVYRCEERLTPKYEDMEKFEVCVFAKNKYYKGDGV